jgi:tRNA A-37 threonylcarbamoyl transferase component Bud32/DNA-binding transcriptional MerR regulator
MTFPRLRLRDEVAGLLDLPWELPLAQWPSSLQFRVLPIGPSRHLVRFLVVDDDLVALKEEPADVADREYRVLNHLERAGLPAVTPIGVARRPEDDTAILVTEYLKNSLQFRRLLSRFPLGPGAYRDRLLDAMAWLLVDLHRGGVFWGDCSLANTLFRRDGDRIQAFLVDAETSEFHPALSDGQRAYDLEILVENVGYGLADVAMLQERPEDLDGAIEAAENVRERYEAIWRELHDEPKLPAGDRHAIRSRLRRLNELGFAVDEIEIVPAQGGKDVRMRVTTSNREFHAHELERLTGIKALEGQARMLLNDMREHIAWLRLRSAPAISEREGAAIWRRDVLDPTLARLAPIIGDRDPIQAYCDVLEHKWLLSERAKRDVGLDAAIKAYLEEGAPAPEVPPTAEAIADEAATADAVAQREDGVADGV